MRRVRNGICGVILASALVISPAVAETTGGEETEAASDENRPHLEDGEAYMGWSLQGNQPGPEGQASPRVLSAPDPIPPPPAAGVPGIDVSHHQGRVDWKSLWDQGKRFVYMKATEGTAFKDPRFTVNYDDSQKQGFIRGAYHFGRPDYNTGAEEARYFVKNGGTWVNDGWTLPGVLDIEYSPSQNTNICYDLSKAEMVAWVDGFVREYTKLTKRAPVIYTNVDWWDRCTGNTRAFTNTAPLWFARWVNSDGELPPGAMDNLPGEWPHYTIWQYWGTTLDQDLFNGNIEDLRYFATNRALYAPRAPDDIFRDVPAKHTFGKQITWLRDEKITTGYADGTFRPRNRITREAMAAFMYRFAGEPHVDLPSKSPFPDVPTNHDFYKPIVWLSKQGITEGYDDGTYRPKNQISREAMAAFLYRYAGKPEVNPPKRSPFDDLPVGHEFYKEIVWLSQAGITTGYDDGTFKPLNRISREATAAFLYRFNS